MKLSLPKKAQEIARLHREILSSLKMTIEKAIRIGELLVQAKAELEHGQWLPWLNNNVPFGVTTAWRYAACYEHRAKFSKLENMTDALALIESMRHWQKQLPAPAVSKNGEPVKKGRKPKGKTVGQALREATERGERFELPPVTDEIVAEVKEKGEKLRVKWSRGCTLQSPIRDLVSKCDKETGKVRAMLGEGTYWYDIKVQRIETCDLAWEP